MIDERCEVCGQLGSFLLGPPARAWRTRYCREHLPPEWFNGGNAGIKKESQVARTQAPSVEDDVGRRETA